MLAKLAKIRMKTSDKCGESGLVSAATTRLSQAQRLRRLFLCALHLAPPAVYRLMVTLIDLGESSADLLLLLRGMVILTDEGTDLVGHPQELFPLLSLEGDGKAPQAVNGQSTLLAHFQPHLPSRRFLQRFVLGPKPLNFFFQIFVGWHVLLIAQERGGGFWKSSSIRSTSGPNTLSVRRAVMAVPVENA